MSAKKISKSLENPDFNFGDLNVPDELSTYTNGSRQKTSNSKNKYPPLHFNVSKNIPNFSGRKKDLKKLIESLNPNNNLTVVSGMGGVGKTSLVRHFVNMNEVKGWNILWLATETEENLTICITEAAKAVCKRTSAKLPENWNPALEEKLAEFYNILDSMGRKTLLIFDNADDFQELFDDASLAKYFPTFFKQHLLRKKFKDPQIIVTTRRKLFLKEYKPVFIEMRPFAKNDAVQFCKASLEQYKASTPEQKNKMIPDIERLCSCLGNYALAIQQATAYLNEMFETCSISEFIDEYKKNVKVFKAKEAKSGPFYSYTVETVFDLSLNVIGKTEKALETMYILSFCEAEKTRIWLFEVLFGERIAKKAVAALLKFNLAELIGTRISVHRIIQKVIRDRVLENVDLFVVVFQAAFVSFKLFKTLQENNQKLDNPKCELNKLLLQHWQLIHGDELAAFVVMMTAFCPLDSFFPWKKIFNGNNWANACSVLEKTCFKWIVLSDSNLIPADLINILKSLSLREKSNRFILLKYISFALKSLEETTNWTKFDLSPVLRKKYIQKLKEGRRNLEVIMTTNVA